MKKHILRLQRNGSKWAIFDTDGVSIYIDMYVNAEGHFCIAQAPQHKLELTQDELRVIRPMVSFYLEHNKLPETLEELTHDINARALLGANSLDFKQAIDIRARIMGRIRQMAQTLRDYIRSIWESRSE